MPFVDDQFDLPSILSALGLNEREQLVYTAFLDGASRPASLVSKQTGLKRGQTYDVLSSLEKKGIVQEFNKGNTRFFSANSPQSLLALFESKEQDFAKNKVGVQHLASYLEKSLTGGQIRRPRVSYYHGTDGIKQIFEDMIHIADSDIRLLMDSKYAVQVASPEFAKWLNSWISRRVAKNVWSYGIFTKSPVADQYLSRPDFKRKSKLIADISLPIQINIYRDKVALLSVHEELMGVVVEDQKYADTLRAIHELLWKFLPDYPAAKDEPLSINQKGVSKAERDVSQKQVVNS